MGGRNLYGADFGFITALSVGEKADPDRNFTDQTVNAED